MAAHLAQLTPLAAPVQPDLQYDAPGPRPVSIDLLPGEYMMVAVCQGGAVHIDAPGRAITWYPSLPVWICLSLPVDALRRPREAASTSLGANIRLELAIGPVLRAVRREASPIPPPPAGPSASAVSEADAARILMPQAGPSRPPTQLDRMPALLAALPRDPPPPATPPNALALAAARAALQPFAACLPDAYLPLFALWCEARATYYSARRDRALSCWQWGLYAAVWLLQLVGAHAIGRRDPRHLAALFDDVGISPPARTLSPFRDWIEGSPYIGSDPLQAIPGVRVADTVQRCYIGRTAFPLTPLALDSFAQLVTAVTPRLAPSGAGLAAPHPPIRGPAIIRPLPSVVLPAVTGPAGGIDDPMRGPPGSVARPDGRPGVPHGRLDGGPHAGLLLATVPIGGHTNATGQPTTASGGQSDPVPPQAAARPIGTAPAHGAGPMTVDSAGPPPSPADWGRARPTSRRRKRPSRRARTRTDRSCPDRGPAWAPAHHRDARRA